jgi:hypothetical protein
MGQRPIKRSNDQTIKYQVFFMVKKYFNQYISSCFLLFVVLGWGCIKSTQLPLDESRLIPMLCDLHIAEAAIAKAKGAEKDTIAQTLYDQVYAIHGITAAELDSSLAQIKRDPFLTEKIYEQVMVELEKKKLEGK